VLSEKKAITLNELSWPKTAKHMGVNWQGKVDSACLTWLIGKPNYKWNDTVQDQFGAGKESSKQAKSDICLAAADTRVCAGTELTPVQQCCWNDKIKKGMKKRKRQRREKNKVETDT
jgi:hypothetical protein